MAICRGVEGCNCIRCPHFISSIPPAGHTTAIIMEYLIHIAILVCIYAILGLSLNLVVGETGLLSITHAAFFGIGAYTTALFIVNTGTNFFIASLAGVVVTGFVAIGIGIVLSRFKGDFYALASFGF